jgi:uncharacterized protein Yka (UPF0111/DUF47 family)
VDITFVEVVKFFTPLVIAALGYFLNRIVTSVDAMEKSVTALREEFAGHRQAMQDYLRRIDQLEKRVDRIDEDLTGIMIDHGKK